MHVFMCDLKTGFFYTAKQRWTSKLERAWDFGSVMGAWECAIGNGLGGVELLLESDGPEEERRVGLELEARAKKF